MSIDSSAAKAVDSIQKKIVDYACALDYAGLSQPAIHAAKALTIDTLGVLISGFCYEPCRMARDVAAQMRQPDGATIIGSRIKTTLDIAAFVNATTARYTEANDVYARYRPGSSHGHPSDVIMPLLAVAEHVRADGRDFITAVVLAYEVYLAICDAFQNRNFDPSTFGCLAVGAAAGKLLGLSGVELAHCISMAVVPNNILGQVRHDHVTMWKAVAAGKAGQAGVFAAMLARAGMEGPHLPFEGKAGWCAHVARGNVPLELRGGTAAPFLILDTRIKPRPARALTIASILAAEKLTTKVGNIDAVQHVRVEVHKQAKHGTGEHYWHPETRESADHSIPYVVAAALSEGMITPSSFNDARLWDPRRRALMQKIEVVENEEFTRSFEGQPQQYRARVTVTAGDGSQLVAESGGDADDLASPKSDAQIAEKFGVYAGDLLGAARTEAMLARLWHLEDMEDVASLPPLCVLT